MTVTWHYTVNEVTQGPFSSMAEAQAHAMLKLAPGTEYLLVSQGPGQVGSNPAGGKVHKTPGS